MMVLMVIIIMWVSVKQLMVNSDEGHIVIYQSYCFSSIGPGGLSVFWLPEVGSAGRT